MFLRLRHDADASLVEVLDLAQLMNPFQATVLARLHGGEELQEPEAFAKADLLFTSGEPLPRCWRDARYREHPDADGGAQSRRGQ